MLRIVGLAGAVGLVVATLFALRGGEFWVSWLIATMYGTSIAVPAKAVLGRLRRRLGTMRELRQWFVYIGAMLVVTAFGSAVTGLAMVALRLVPLGQFWSSYQLGFLISLVIAVPASAGAATYARLVTRVHASERIAADAQLASLESRVRPHFLFNALNSAIALIPEEPARAEDVLERLAALLRFSLDRQQARLVPLSEELRIVVDYLEIERARFGERLRYHVDVAAALERCEVPAFALQTIVENCVKHAIGTRQSGGEIRITARREHGRLSLEVTDDGPGFTGPLPAGHGLDTLRARLAALYGTDARLEAPLPSDAGARVAVEVPA